MVRPSVFGRRKRFRPSSWEPRRGARTRRRVFTTHPEQRERKVARSREGTFVPSAWIASAVLKLKDAGIDADSIKDNAVNIIIATVMGVIAFAE